MEMTTGAVPLSWAGSTEAMDYLNFGDALSPVMVALLTGRPIERVSTRSKTTRLAAVGTIGHGFALGETWFWGTGCSPWRNPSAPAAEREPFVPPPDSRFVIAATRGPLSEALIAGTNGDRPGVYGDPVWLMPRFYRPQVAKRWKLGVILHLSELADRAYEAHPRPEMRRFDIPGDLAEDVHLITTCTPIAIDALGAKFDEILACERIVSTSLHGMVIAESYGIPCLYFAPHGAATGVEIKPLVTDHGLDARIVDLYTGLGMSTLATWVQPRTSATDWTAVMAGIDRHWHRKRLDEDRLMSALPLPLAPVRPEPGETIWQHPVLRSLRLQHAIADVRENDGKVAAQQAQGPAPFRPTPRRNVGLERQELLGRLVSARAGIPLSWVASTTEMPFANLGDALSAVVVAALAGLPVRHAHFDAPVERLVGVGTIGHAQKNGILHFWGTGLDQDRNPVAGAAPYSAPPGTRFHVHATRGPRTEAALRAAGVTVGTPAHGDPVSLLPRIWPMRDVTRTCDLGVIVHITELDRREPGSAVRPDYRRYEIPDAFKGRVKIIDTLTEPTLEELKAKVAEIVSCRAILSTSLHGLVIAEAYGIPAAWFRTTGTGEGLALPLSDPDETIDHRMRDFYLGAGASHLATFAQDREAPTDWQAAIDFVSGLTSGLAVDNDRLIEAFPLPLAPRDDDGLWPLTQAAREAFVF